MTNRERALNIIRGKKWDAMPAVHFGYWAELLVEWAGQGHLSMETAKSWGDGNAADREIDKLLGWDFNYYNCSGSRNGLSPVFEHKVIERLPDGFVRVQNACGLIERMREGAEGIPAEDDYLLKDREAWETLYKPKLQFSAERVPFDYYNAQYNEKFDKEDRPRGIMLGSLLGEIRNMVSVVGMSYLIGDDYDLFREIVDTYAELQYRCAAGILSTKARFDYGHYWEDVCFKNGPLISPVMFEDLFSGHYKKRNELCRKNGIDLISLDCDGDIVRLAPIWYDCGVRVMFPIEVGSWGGNILTIREKSNPGMMGVGGMDKTVLRKDKKAVDAEIERLKPLIASGHYLPCPDHRLMPGTKWELTQYYIEKIKKVK